MDRATIVSRLTKVFRDVFDDNNIDLQDKMTARDIAAWDSVAHIRLMLSIEDEFHFKFDMDEISELRNVGELVDTILNRVG